MCSFESRTSKSRKKQTVTFTDEDLWLKRIHMWQPQPNHTYSPSLAMVSSVLMKTYKNAVILPDTENSCGIKRWLPLPPVLMKDASTSKTWTWIPTAQLSHITLGCILQDDVTDVYYKMMSQMFTTNWHHTEMYTASKCHTYVYYKMMYTYVYY